MNCFMKFSNRIYFSPLQYSSWWRSRKEQIEIEEARLAKVFGRTETVNSTYVEEIKSTSTLEEDKNLLAAKKEEARFAKLLGADFVSSPINPSQEKEKR